MAPGTPKPLVRSFRRRERPIVRCACALALALMVNGAALVLLTATGAFALPRRAAEVRLAALPAGRWEANREIREAPPPLASPAASPAPPPVRREAPPEPELAPPGQLVDVAPSPDPRPPERARFVADRDNRVEKEMRSRVTGKFDVPAPRPTNGPGGPQGAPLPGALGAEEESRPGAVGPRTEASAGASAARPAEESDRPGALVSEARRRAAVAALRAMAGEPGEDGLRRAGAYDPRLLPTAATFSELAGGPADDALEGVAEGDGTFLATRGWRYASFISRLRREVLGAWDPDRPLAAHDPAGRLERRATWYTSVAVVLDAAGALKHLEVRRPCGLTYLDAAALEAFRKAQPFVNPPRGLVDANGEIRFRFGFRYKPPGELDLGAAAAALRPPG